MKGYTNCDISMRCNKKVWATDTCSTMNASQNDYAAWMKPEEEYILYDPIWAKCRKCKVIADELLPGAESKEGYRVTIVKDGAQEKCGGLWLCLQSCDCGGDFTRVYLYITHISYICQNLQKYTI